MRYNNVGICFCFSFMQWDEPRGSLRHEEARRIPIQKNQDQKHNPSIHLCTQPWWPPRWTVTGSHDDNTDTDVPRRRLPPESGTGYMHAAKIIMCHCCVIFLYSPSQTYIIMQISILRDAMMRGTSSTSEIQSCCHHQCHHQRLHLEDVCTITQRIK